MELTNTCALGNTTDTVGSQHYFNLGGLSGFPFAGAVGVGAMRSHIPTGGHALALYGPHVGFSNGKILGKVERFGIKDPNGCCGSALAAMRAINAEGVQDTGSVSSKASRSGSAYSNKCSVVSESSSNASFNSMNKEKKEKKRRGRPVAISGKVKVRQCESRSDELRRRVYIDSNVIIKLMQGLTKAQKKGSLDEERSPVPTSIINLQQTHVKQQICSHCDDNEAGNLTLDRLPVVTYEAINDDMDMLLGINSETGLRDLNLDDNTNTLVVLGGILINTAPEHQDYFLPLRFDVYTKARRSTSNRFNTGAEPER